MDTGGNGDGADAPAQAGAPPLPCQDSNKGNEHTGKALANHASAYRKTAAALALNVAYFVERFGINRVGFLTLTFAEHITKPAEAQERFKSLRTGVISDRYEEWIRVFERQKSGRIHYHLLVALRGQDTDIRTGVNWLEFEQKVYRTANHRLREEWAFWRRAAPLYKFGRTELLPVKSCAEAIGCYVGKYIAKHLDCRLPEDKGVHLVKYSRGWKVASCAFAWNSPASWLWRKKLAEFASAAGAETMEDLQRMFGSKWAYHLGDAIRGMQLKNVVYPTRRHAELDRQDVSWIPAGATEIKYGERQQVRTVTKGGASHATEIVNPPTEGSFSMRPPARPSQFQKQVEEKMFQESMEEWDMGMRFEDIIRQRQAEAKAAKQAGYRRRNTYRTFAPPSSEAKRSAEQVPPEPRDLQGRGGERSCSKLGGEGAVRDP